MTENKTRTVDDTNNTYTDSGHDGVYIAMFSISTVYALMAAMFMHVVVVFNQNGDVNRAVADALHRPIQTLLTSPAALEMWLLLTIPFLLLNIYTLNKLCRYLKTT